MSGAPPDLPALSVVIPTHNRLPLLATVLRRLDEQEDVEPGSFEVIVVVNGSTDGTASALESMRTGFPLRVIERKRGGVAGARNEGIRASRAGVVLFLDDDIIPSPRLVAVHLKAHAEQPSLVVLGRFSPDTAVRRTAWTRYEEMVQEKKYRALSGDEVPSGIRFYSGNVSVARPLLEATGGFDVGLVRNEDVDLGFRLQAAGASFRFEPEADGTHRGYHDLPTWLSTARLYGKLDVAIYRSRGYAGGLESIVACYHDRNPLNRLMVRVGLASPRTHGLLVGGGVLAGRAAHGLRLERVSYAALSAVSNLQYWAGICDGLRSKSAFWSLVAATRRWGTRPYSLSGGPVSRRGGPGGGGSGRRPAAITAAIRAMPIRIPRSRPAAKDTTTGKAV